VTLALLLLSSVVFEIQDLSLIDPALACAVGQEMVTLTAQVQEGGARLECATPREERSGETRIIVRLIESPILIRVHAERVVGRTVTASGAVDLRRGRELWSAPLGALIEALVPRSVARVPEIVAPPPEARSLAPVLIPAPPSRPRRPPLRSASG